MGKNKDKKKKKRKDKIYSDSLIEEAKRGENKSIKMEIQHQDQGTKAENVKKLDPNEFKDKKPVLEPNKLNNNKSIES